MKELAAALVEAQKTMPAVDKTGSSNFGSHITLDHLIASTRKHLAAHDLSIAQFPCVLETGQPGLRTVLLHTSGESLTADAPLFLGDRQTMQALGAALTYARRQGWSAVLGISTEADDDADSISLSQNALSSPAAAPVRQEGAASTAPSDPSKQKPQEAVSEEDLLLLVADKGGDVPAFKAALETARGTAEFPAWLAFQKGHWEKAKKPFKAPPGVAA